MVGLGERNHHQMVGRGPACPECQKTEIEHERALIADPDAWSRWPSLPVKRYVGSDLEVAVLYSTADHPEQGPMQLRLGNLFDSREEIGQSKWIKFDTFDEMFAAGWRID
jgi:hypothetical protein